jgi:hypothetical protein
MSGDWSIHVPHRTRDDSLVDVAGLARALPADERAVTRQVAINARLDGLATAGDLLDRLQELNPAERRALLDTARAQCGLLPTHEVDVRRGAALRTLAPDSRPMQMVRTEGGALVERYGDTGTTAELDERRRAVERQAREAERAIDAAHQFAHRQALDERLMRELPPHLRPPTKEAA